MSLGISSNIAKKYGLNEELCIEFDKDDRGMKEVINASSEVMFEYTKELRSGVQLRCNSNFLNNEGFSLAQNKKAKNSI